VVGSGSPATAKRLIQTLPIAHQVERVNGGLGKSICMDFTGDGRTDIVLTVWTAMNHGAHYWAAFRADSGRHWVRAAFHSDCCGHDPRHGGIGIGIKRNGKLIVISQPVYRPRDPLCCPSGGKKSRTWGWRNGRLQIVGP
jgi:hypothetical protein